MSILQAKGRTRIRQGINGLPRLDNKTVLLCLQRGSIQAEPTKINIKILQGLFLQLEAAVLCRRDGDLDDALDVGNAVLVGGVAEGQVAFAGVEEFEDGADRVGRVFGELDCTFLGFFELAFACGAEEGEFADDVAVGEEGDLAGADE